MARVPDDHLIQACAANTPDAPLDGGVLPRTSWGNQHFFDSHPLHTLPKRGPIDPVPIAQQIPRGLVPRKGSHHLVSRPQRRGVFRDVRMDDAAPFMGQDEQDEEHFVGPVGTTKKSRDTNSCIWFFKKVFHGGDDGLRSRTRHVSTVDLAVSMPSLRSSPMIWGEPHVGFACYMSRISMRTSWAIAGRPGLPCWLKSLQWCRKRWCCQARIVRGWTKASACCQPAQRRERHAQNRRSLGRTHG
jgi:hypothetical protein